MEYQPKKRDLIAIGVISYMEDDVYSYARVRCKT